MLYPLNKKNPFNIFRWHQYLSNQPPIATAQLLNVKCMKGVGT